jgi:HPt (histidine-containing phosphotransfer) domain-containing protein
MADDVIYIDIEDGKKRVMDNIKLYTKLLTKFKDDTNLSVLEEALAASENEKAQGAAHALKGISANLSLKELYKQSLEIETQIKSGSINPDQIGVLKNVYTQTMIEIEKVITQYAG